MTRNPLGDSRDPVLDWLAARGSGAAGGIGRRSETGPTRASWAQRRMWFEDQLRRQIAAGLLGYATPRAVRLRGDLDVAALSAALSAVVARHEALRTTFTLLDGELVQRVRTAEVIDLPVVGIGGTTAAERETALAEALDAVISAPFDLEAGPVMRAALFGLGECDHVLLVVVHHIATDGWSMDVLFRELAQGYAALREGRRPEFAPLAVQYADFAEWQWAQWERGTFAEDLAYWRRQLAGAPALLELPTDRPRPPVQSFRGDAVPFRMPAPVMDRVAGLAWAEDASAFMVLLAAVQLLVARWSGQPDVVIGAVVPCRYHPDLEPLIGFFANMLPLRAHIDERQSFRQLLRRVRDSVLDAYEHQQLSFDRLVEELAPERTLAHSPLVQVVISYAEGGGTAPFGTSLRLRPAEQSHYDLALVVQHGPDGLDGDIHFATDLFDRATVQRFGEHLAALVDEVTTDPDRILVRTCITTAAEAAELRGRFHGPPPTRRASDVVGLVGAAAAPPRGGSAVWAPDGVLSHTELAQRSARRAARLASAGVLKGMRVGVCLPRGAAFLVAMLGIWRAGAVYVPLDPSYPADRLMFMIEDSELTVVITQSGSGGEGGWPPRLTIVDVDADDAAEAPLADVALRPDDVAYVIYTSGSTGRPKGVQVDHGALANTVQAQIDHFGLSDADRCSQMSSPSFDASLMESLPVLVAGGQVVVVPDEVRADPGRLWEFLADRGVTVSFMTTPVLDLARSSAPAVHPSLRCIQTGGDRLSVVPQSLPCRLSNVYGPTEATIASTAGWIDTDVAHIGTPLPGTGAYVLDPWLRPVPTGVPGELFLSGAGIAHGYLNRPGLTAQRFLPDVVAGDGTRMYRSGDLVRWRTDGTLEYLGRVDRQVKLRGFRIEPAEIESVLAELPEVSAAVVLLREDVPGGPALVAYCSSTTADTLSVEALRGHAAARLPDFMVPARYVLMDRMPVTANGKVDRAALPKPDLVEPRVAGVAPRGPIEEAVAQVWSELLGVPTVSAGDNFFALGGHSLLATQACARLSDRLGCRVPLVRLFELPVLADFAAAIEADVVQLALADEALAHEGPSAS